MPPPGEASERSGVLQNYTRVGSRWRRLAVAGIWAAIIIVVIAGLSPFIEFVALYSLIRSNLVSFAVPPLLASALAILGTPLVGWALTSFIKALWHGSRGRQFANGIVLAGLLTGTYFLAQPRAYELVNPVTEKPYYRWERTVDGKVRLWPVWYKVSPTSWQKLQDLTPAIAAEWQQQHGGSGRAAPLVGRWVDIECEPRWVYAKGYESGLDARRINLWIERLRIAEGETIVRAAVKSSETSGFSKLFPGSDAYLTDAEGTRYDLRGETGDYSLHLSDKFTKWREVKADEIYKFDLAFPQLRSETASLILHHPQFYEIKLLLDWDGNLKARKALKSIEAENSRIGSPPNAVAAISSSSPSRPAEPVEATPITRQVVADFVFDLQSCKLGGTSITCEFTVENVASDDRSFVLHISQYGVSSQVSDDLGTEYPAHEGVLGSKREILDWVFNHKSLTERALVPQVPIRAVLRFEGVRAEATHISLLRIAFASGDGQYNASFTNVALKNLNAELDRTSTTESSSAEQISRPRGSLKTVRKAMASDFIFELKGCGISATNVTCEFTVTNSSREDKELKLYHRDSWTEGEPSRFFDQVGHEYLAANSQLGSRRSDGWVYVSNKLVASVTISAALNFQDIQSETTTIRLLRVSFGDSVRGNAHIDFTNISLGDTDRQARVLVQGLVLPSLY